MDRPNLAKFLGATSTDVFFSEVVDRNVLHSKSSFTSEDIDSLLSVNAINSLFSRFPLNPARYQIISGGRVDPNPTLHPAGGMDPDLMREAFRSGHTIRLNSVHDSVPGVRRLTRELAAECGCSMFANVYMTPAGNPGFNPHYDDHDVIVLQCHGSKEWRIHDEYENKEILPLSGFEYDPVKYAPGPPSKSFTLRPGDTFYVPRGHMHSAISQEQDSVHITFSLNWPTWNELLVDMIARAAIDKVDLRGSIVSKFKGRAPSPSIALGLIRDLVDEALNEKAVEMSMDGVMKAHEDMYFSDAKEVLDERILNSWPRCERAA